MSLVTVPKLTPSFSAGTKGRVNMKRSLHWFLVLGCVGVAGSCGRHDDGQVGVLQQANVAPYPPPPPPPPAQCPPPPGTRPDPTVINIDPFVLVRFPLRRVLDQVIALQGVPQTAGALYSQLWDTFDVQNSPILPTFPDDPHCSDPGAINNFQVACPLPDRLLKTGVPEDFEPTALTNRFDLAPRDARHCGEYRIVYARTGGNFGGRDFVIWEGILPNPRPGCIEACRPVVDFWEGLAALDPNNPVDQNELANRLERFYFRGLPGFEPVVHPDHYGMDGGSAYGNSGGQVRTNLFKNQDSIQTKPQRWRLHERLLVAAVNAKGVPRLRFLPVTDKNDPFPDLFNFLTAEGRGPAFQAFFPSQVATLVDDPPTDDIDKINGIGMNSDDRFNDGESNSQNVGGPATCGPSPGNRSDLPHCTSLGSPPNAFTTAINNAAIAASRPDLTHVQVTERAGTQLCSGCHQLSNNQPIGSNQNPLTWPPSLGFVHIDESSNLSEALQCFFLPGRKRNLDAFFNSPPVDCQGPILVKVDARDFQPLTISNKPVGSAN